MNLLFNILVILSSLLPYSVVCIKCYICEYNAAFCKGHNCYNNPDICSNSQFSTALVPVADCPRNCMYNAITNPSGFVIKWSRFCAPANDPTKGFNCKIDYKIGARIDQCICDKNFCNNSNHIRVEVIVIPFCLSLSLILYQLMQI